MEENYFTIKNLCKSFTSAGGRVTKALDDVSIILKKGEILSIVGHNGSGKTTLLNSIRGDFPIDRGTIFVNGRDIRKTNLRTVSVCQDVDTGVVPSMTAMENLALVMSESSSFLYSFPTKHYKEEIHKFLSDVGLYNRFVEFGQTITSDLSGGQRHQLAIIMAMMRKPEILLLDEFIANLDPVVSSDILKWTREHIRNHKITTLNVTHDLDLAESWGDSILELYEGKIKRFSKVGLS